MHITRLEVRHWRRHDHLLLADLSERITLICGANEAGKSTLAEALRFALFEPCKPVYDARKALQQRGGSEPPEVEVDLAVGGQRWRVAKRFLRRQQTRLSGPDGRTLEGEEAERRLQELVGIAIPDAGRVTRDVDARHLGLWPVLWLQQGQLAELGGAVTDGVRSRLGELVAREVGAAAAGPRGARALALVQQEHDLSWTGAAMRPTGEYAKALKERAAAQARRDEAQRVLRGFEGTVAQLHDLGERLAAFAPRLRAAAEQAEAAGQRALLAAERFRDFDRQRALLADLRRAAGDVEALLAERTARSGELVRLRHELAEITGKEAALADELDRREQAQLRLEAEAGAAQLRAKAAEEATERATLGAERAALIRRSAEGADQLARIQRLAEERAQAQARADALPELAPRTISALRELAAAWRDACTQRDAAATAVIFQAERASGVRWTADGQVQESALPAGGTFTGRTSGLGELHLAGIGTVRIRTGAGGAADLAATAEAAGAALETALRAAQVASPDAAQALAQARLEAVADSRRAAAALAAALALDARADDGAIATAIAHRQRTAAAEQARLATMPEPAEAGPDPEATRQQARAARDQEQAARGAQDAGGQMLRRLRDGRHTAQTAVAIHGERARRTAEDLARLPEPAALAQRQTEAGARLGEAVNRAAELAAAWEALGGAAAASEAEDLARVAQRLTAEAGAARQQREVLHIQLRAATDQDPAAALQEAEAELARAQERAAAEERQAEAVRTLLGTLLEVQKETRATLAAPVRRAIEPYLRRVFPRADLLLGDDDWHLAGWSADAVEEPFEQLSLGAREQFALLVRLGLAEVLAQGDRLPLVLDDPLVNADPQRRVALLQALRHASRKLQIILFTCHEAEHDGLAAEQTVVLPGR